MAPTQSSPEPLFLMPAFLGRVPLYPLRPFTSVMPRECPLRRPALASPPVVLGQGRGRLLMGLNRLLLKAFSTAVGRVAGTLKYKYRKWVWNLSE